MAEAVQPLADRQPGDDPVTQSNLRGFVTFAQTGAPNSRTAQVFIDYDNHPRLDATGFAPFGKVVKGMDVVDALYRGYGDGAPEGQGPSQERSPGHDANSADGRVEAMTDVEIAAIDAELRGLLRGEETRAIATSHQKSASASGRKR